MDNSSPDSFCYSFPAGNGLFWTVEIEGWWGPKELDLSVTTPSAERVPMRFEGEMVRSRRIRSVLSAGSYADMTFHRNEYELLSAELSEVAMRAIKMFVAKQRGS
jgi:hypothetical protein